MYGPNGRFLYSAFGRFFRDDLLAFLDGTASRPRVNLTAASPASNRSEDVVSALQRYLEGSGVRLRNGRE